MIDCFQADWLTGTLSKVLAALSLEIFLPAQRGNFTLHRGLTGVERCRTAGATGRHSRSQRPASAIAAQGYVIIQSVACSRFCGYFLWEAAGPKTDPCYAFGLDVGRRSIMAGAGMMDGLVRGACRREKCLSAGRLRRLNWLSDRGPTRSLASVRRSRSIAPRLRNHYVLQTLADPHG